MAEKECTTGAEFDDPWNVDEFELTKCITIQAHGRDRPSDRPNPTNTWMQYLHVSSGQPQYLSEFKNINWKTADNVLLHIDIPNQQVYPLPLLVTPVYCVYIVTFDLPEREDEEEKALKSIHDTLKDVYAYSTELDVDAEPAIFLVGLQNEEKGRSSFAQRLKQMLGTRSYQRLLVFPGGDIPYWLNSRECSIHDNTDLLTEIQSSCCPPQHPICQSLEHHRTLSQQFRDPIVLHKDVEAKMADVVPGTSESYDLEQFLNVLHCYGLIFYRSLPGKSEKVVVLQPQYLRQLFQEVLDQKDRRSQFTITDLLRMKGKHLRDKRLKEWFQAMCINMGLVIERIISGKPRHVFVMALDRECNPPERAHYSVDPLLVTYRPPDEQKDYFLPSPLFPTFISKFLKKLQELYKSSTKTISMKRQYLHVSVNGSTQIHVVERESFVEIGLQQFHMGQTDVQQLDKLQQPCQDVYGIVSESAKDAAASLRLDSNSLQYGFLCHPDDTERVDHFGEFNSEYEPPTVTCSCCSIPQTPTSQQKIWFCDVDHEKVVVQPVLITMGGGSKAQIRKLLEAVPTEPEPPVTPTDAVSTPVCQGSKRSFQPDSPEPPSGPGQPTAQPETMEASCTVPTEPETPVTPSNAVPRPVPAQQTSQRKVSVTYRTDHLMLFRTHVSKNAAGKTKAVLEGVGLDSATIASCISTNPLNDVEAVQEGLTRWKGGKGTQPPTWGVLIKAMKYAEIAQQDVEALEGELGLFD